MADPRCTSTDDIQARVAAAAAELRQGPLGCEPHPEPDVIEAAAGATEEEPEDSAVDDLSKVALALAIFLKSSSRGQRTPDAERAREAALSLLRINGDRLASRSCTLLQRLAVLPGTAASRSCSLISSISQVGAAWIKKGADRALERGRFLRRDAVLIVARTLSQLEELQVLQLRNPESSPNVAEWLGSRSSDFDGLFDELRRFPRCAVPAIMLLVLRLVWALNALGDVAIDELLHGNTTASRVGLAAAVLPGWLVLFRHRRTVLEDVFFHSTPGDDARGELHARKSSQRLAKLARNLTRMPPIFWLTTSVSGAVTLQVIRNLGASTVRRVLRLRLRLLLAGTAIAASLTSDKAVACCFNVTACVAERSVECLPPDAARTVSTMWYDFQVTLRAASAGFMSVFFAALDAARMSSQEHEQGALSRLTSAITAFINTSGHALHDGVVVLLRRASERIGLALPPGSDGGDSAQEVPSALLHPAPPAVTQTLDSASDDVASPTVSEEDDRMAPVFRGRDTEAT